MKQLSKKLYSYLYYKSWSLGLWTPPDRRFLIESIFPAYSQSADFKKILFVGVHRYTRQYPRRFSDRKFTTIDFDPKVKRFGATNHIVGNILQLNDYQNTFGHVLDLVFLNGVIGFGLDGIEDIEKGVEQLASNMRAGAVLMIGSNPDKISAEQLYKVTNRFFTPTELAGLGGHEYRFTMPRLKNAVHEYRFFERHS
jgi:hypothetical protein